MKMISKVLLCTAVITFCSMCSVGTKSLNNSGTSNNNINSKIIAINSPYKTISIAEGEQYQLHLYDEQQNNITESAIWTSDNPNIASVNNGLVTIKSNTGSANIYATYENQKSNSIQFNSGRVIFITQNLYNGNLVDRAKEKNPMITNGNVAADYLCNQDNNKPEFGNFRALVSDLNSKNNFNHVIDTTKTINYINKDGSFIGNSQLFGPDNKDHTISVTGVFYDNTQTFSIWNWSGFENNCNNWTSSASTDVGGVGFGNGSNSWYNDQNATPILHGMWAYLSEVNCEHYQSLICVQQ